MKIHDKVTHRDMRRELRNNSTPAEKELWQALKGKRMEGYKFRRQHGIGRYIVDFYCPNLRLIIEVDGSIHQQNNAGIYDALREKELSMDGFYTLRFSNQDILLDLGKAMSKIQEVCMSRAQQKEKQAWFLNKTPSR